MMGEMGIATRMMVLLLWCRPMQTTKYFCAHYWHETKMRTEKQEGGMGSRMGKKKKKKEEPRFVPRLRGRIGPWRTLSAKHDCLRLRCR